MLKQNRILTCHENNYRNNDVVQKKNPDFETHFLCNEKLDHFRFRHKRKRI